jgi:long-chain acyl-CoA synthetase
VVNLLDQWEASVRRAPDAPAVYDFDGTLTFGQLDARAEGFGGWLQAQGVRPGDRVAIQMQNDPEFPIAQYGIWKAGAIAVPMSPMFKEREVAYQLADCGARLMVTREMVTSAEPHPLKREPCHELAYLVYTSGTTGEPKGAMCPHRCMAHTSAVFEELLGITPEDIILGAAPLFHVTGLVAHLALSARCGIPLVLFHRFDAERAWRAIERRRTTVTVAAITAYIALLNHPLASRERFRSMTKCFTGGAPVAASFIERFERELGVYIHNTYGLTESNSPSHITPLGERAPVDPASGALAVGRPVPGCEATILDGEIALRGANIFPGYWNRPEATAACFRDGWFLTGDIGVRDENGWYYVVDRKKDMIVCSGFKVYPREVEDVLYQHPSVREAAVVGVLDDYRGETVKAFVALRAPATEEELIRFCRERMAAYKYPRSIEFLDEVPKTATGKFLRRALRGLSAAR